MKNKNSDVQSEIDSLKKEIDELKVALRLTIDTLDDAVYALRFFKEQRLTDAKQLIR